MHDKEAVIYQIINIIDGKVYVGSAKTWRIRRRNHKSELKHNKHYNVHLQRAWNKDGEENFVFEVLEVLSDRSRTNIKAREQFWLDELQAYNRDFGYNMLPKAHSMIGAKITEETKEKIRAKMKARPPEYMKELVKKMIEGRKSVGYNVEHLRAYHGGANNPGSKITESDVITIKELLAEGHSYRTIAEKFGVKPSTIGAINQNRSWQNVGNPCNARRGSARLTRDEVILIKKMLAEGTTQEAIAKKFGVKRPTIGSIAQGKSWADVII